LTVKIYADEACKNPIEVVGWDNKVIVTFISGEKVALPNMAVAGAKAKAHVWVRNEWIGKFYVTSISHPDERLKFSMKTKTLPPDRAVKLTISFSVPKNPTEENALKDGDLVIKGYYQYVE